MLHHFNRTATRSTYTLTYVTNLVNVSNLTTYTFTSASIGTAAAGRRIIVAIAYYSGTTSATISSVTVAGLSCTAISNSTVANEFNAVFISPVIASGTTANIVVTASNVCDNLGIGVYTLNGTGNYSITNNVNYQVVAKGLYTTNNSVTATVANYNIGNSILWASRGRSAHAGTWSFSGTIPVTENYDSTVETGFTGMSAGINNATANYASGSVTHTTSGTSPFGDSYALIRFF